MNTKNRTTLKANPLSLKTIHWIRVVPLTISLFLSAVLHAFAWSSNPPSIVLATLPEAYLVGKSTFRWLGLNIYEAQLWSNISNRGVNYKTDSLWLELRYAKAFKSDDIVKRSIKEIKHIGQLPAYLENIWLNDLQSIIPSVKAGDSLGALRIPQKGLVFYHNGEQVGTLANEQLAVAFIGIWLDPKTSAPKMRNQLLNLQK